MARRRFQKVLGRTQQVKILDFLAERKRPASVVEIQKKIKVHYIYATKLVNGLEAAGLLTGTREGQRHMVVLNENHALVRAIQGGKRAR